MSVLAVLNVNWLLAVFDGVYISGPRVVIEVSAAWPRYRMYVIHTVEESKEMVRRRHWSENQL